MTTTNNAYNAYNDIKANTLIEIPTTYGTVNIEPIVAPEKDEQHRSGRILTKLTINNTEYVIRVNFNQKGQPVSDWRFNENDPKAFDITYSYDPKNTHIMKYAPINIRNQILTVLAQAFAEATYTEKFQKVNAYYTMKHLTHLLRQRTKINNQLHSTLKELNNMGIINQEMTVKQLPSWFNTGEEHRLSFEGAIEQMTEHVRQFPLTKEQQETLDTYGNGCDQGSWTAIDNVHRQVCPLLIVKEEYWD